MRGVENNNSDFSKTWIQTECVYWDVMRSAPTILWHNSETDKKMVSSFDSILEEFVWWEFNETTNDTDIQTIILSADSSWSKTFETYYDWLKWQYDGEIKSGMEPQ